MKVLFLLKIIFLFTVSVKAQSTLTSSKDNAAIIDSIEDQPKFRGGEKAFKRFLKKNLKWPIKAMEAQGTVYVTFIIQENGRLTNAKILRGLGQPFDEEALRVINKSPTWIPAIKNGKAVAMKYSVPINFYIAD